MFRRLLWQRAFKTIPLMFVMAFFLLFIGIVSYAFYHIYIKGVLVQDKHLLRLLPWLASGFAVLAWGVVGILKADICRSSTSMIPHFRRKLLNFFLGFGVILGTISFLFLLNPVWDPSWLRHLRIVLPLGLFLFGIFLFMSHVFPSWIAFLGFLAFLGMIENYPTHFGFLEPLSYPLLIISPFIIWQYRTMMLKMNEDHRFYRTMSYPGFGTAPWKTMKMQASCSGPMGVGWQFEHILKLCRYRRRLGSIFLPLLIVLRNSGGLFNPLLLTFILIAFSSLPTRLLIFLFPFCAGIMVFNMKLFGERLLPLEIVKPLSRKKIFLWEYLSYYFLFLIIFLLFRLGVLLRPYNPLYHWLESGMRGGIPHWLESGMRGGIPPHESVLVAGSFFLISFLVLSIRQASSLRNSVPFLFIGLPLTMTLASLSEIIGLLPILTIFSILTVLFLIIALRLDCRKDI